MQIPHRKNLKRKHPNQIRCQRLKKRFNSGKLYSTDRLVGLTQTSWVPPVAQLCRMWRSVYVEQFVHFMNTFRDGGWGCFWSSRSKTCTLTFGNLLFRRRQLLLHFFVLQLPKNDTLVLFTVDADTEGNSRLEVSGKVPEKGRNFLQWCDECLEKDDKRVKNPENTESQCLEVFPAGAGELAACRAVCERRSVTIRL